jgi:hypothetical protein
MASVAFAKRNPRIAIIGTVCSVISSQETSKS